MKEKKQSQNLNNTQIKGKQNKSHKKKGGATKVVLIIIIIIMAIVIGILSWLLASGKEISTILDDMKESLNLSSEKTEQSDKNEKDENNSDDNDKNKGEDKNITGNVSGKGGDNENISTNTNLKELFKVRYDTRGVRNITIGGASFVCNEDVPEISGISTTAANKMEKYLTDWYSRVWKDIDSQTSDDYIKELLENMNESMKENPNYTGYDIGFHQSYKVVYLTNKLVTFQYIFEGGLGGVGWGNTSGVSFDLQTGDVIEIKNLVTSKNKYIEACKKYVYDELKRDSRYQEVLEMHGNDYQSKINSAIEKLGGYFTESGIVCAEIPKYDIASGASGEFKFTIPYSLVKDYIDNKYIENNINTSKKGVYTTEELEKMALDYYEKQTGYRPSHVASDVNQDGTVSIQLYDNMGDHNSTSAWYTVDPKTAVGTDIMDNKIDLKK